MAKQRDVAVDFSSVQKGRKSASAMCYATRRTGDGKKASQGERRQNGPRVVVVVAVVVVRGVEL